jgi:acyl-CoA thioesterase FadM
MPRIELEFPPEPVFSTELPIRIDDINYGGHLANDAVLSLAQEARLRFLVSHGFTSELDLAGAGLIMIDAAVVYRAEGLYGMVLRVDLAVVDVRTRGFDLLYRMADVGSGREIALVRTGFFTFDYAAHKVVSMPAPLRAMLAALPPPRR